MKVNDLIILLFPKIELDSEVLEGGTALFNKHVSRHMLGLKQPHTDTAALLKELGGKAQSIGKSLAQRAWLIQVANKEDADLSGAVKPNVHYKILAASAEFSPGTLDKTSTGIYVVSHCDYGLLNVFGHYGMHPDVQSGGLAGFEKHIDAAASKLAVFLKKLGVENFQKLCLVACNTVPRDAKQKDLLESLIWKLHEQGLHPKVAGWDIPVVMITAGNDYGSKMHQTEKQMAASLRKKNKFVYQYENLSDSFTLKTEKAKDEQNINNQMTRELKKGTLKQEMRGDPQPIWTKTEKGDGKTEVAWRMETVRKLKYTPTNWSA